VAFLRNSTTGTIIATRIDRLSGFFQRAIGLLARSNVRPDEGVWIASCHAIHTIGMRQTIDVMFVDRDGFVLRICRNVGPNRFSLSCRHAQSVVELGAGSLDQIDVMVGDRLQLVATPDSGERSERGRA
jgi:uncharacterized membrane protein (UPF0127 family)